MLRDLDALIVVSSPWVDGASAAGQTMEWLANRGYTGLLHRTVVVLNDSDGHADKRTRSMLVQQFASRGQVVVEVPFDSHLRPGGVIDVTTEMSPLTRRRFIEIAAAIAEHFAVHHRRTAGAPVTTVRRTGLDPGRPHRDAGGAAVVPGVDPCRRLASDRSRAAGGGAAVHAGRSDASIAINRVLRGRGDDELPPAPYEFARAAGMSALAPDVSLAGHKHRRR